jgi:sulfoxide reductase heme-binding subunit YedZ
MTKAGRSNPRSERGAGYRAVLFRSAAVGLVALALVGLFWASRPQWVADMRLWRAVGDASFVLLALSLAIGPAGRLFPALSAVGRWRRQFGIWTALTGLLHTVLVLWQWVAFDLGRLMGYEFVPQLGRTARLEPGFGLANLMGLVAMAWLLVLLATSSDRAVRRLGPAVWSWIQGFAHVVFYLVVLHAAYFLYMHYTLSFHRAIPEPNWFRLPLLMLASAVIGLQVASSVRGAGRRPTAHA